MPPARASIVVAISGDGEKGSPFRRHSGHQCARDRASLTGCYLMTGATRHGATDAWTVLAAAAPRRACCIPERAWVVTATRLAGRSSRWTRTPPAGPIGSRMTSPSMLAAPPLHCPTSARRRHLVRTRSADVSADRPRHIVDNGEDRHCHPERPRPSPDHRENLLGGGGPVDVRHDVGRRKGLGPPARTRRPPRVVGRRAQRHHRSEPRNAATPISRPNRRARPAEQRVEVGVRNQAAVSALPPPDVDSRVRLSIVDRGDPTGQRMTGRSGQGAEFSRKVPRSVPASGACPIQSFRGHQRDPDRRCRTNCGGRSVSPGRWMPTGPPVERQATRSRRSCPRGRPPSWTAPFTMLAEWQAYGRAGTYAAST